MEQAQRPRVQIPVGADHHGLSIDGEFVYAYPNSHMHPGDENLSDQLRDYLPERANEAYWNHYETDNLGMLFQCTECGYLTMANALSVTAYRTYECGNDACSNTTGKSTRDGFRKCSDYDVVVDLDTGDTKPLGEVSAEEVPNHPSHFGRIQNQLAAHVDRGDLLDIVADAVADARAQGYVDY